MPDFLEQVIDRNSPTVLAQGAQPSNGAYSPGAPISLKFSEEVNCARPYSFAASILIAFSTPVTVTPVTLCIFNSIELQLPSSVVV